MEPYWTHKHMLIGIFWNNRNNVFWETVCTISIFFAKKSNFFFFFFANQHLPPNTSLKHTERLPSWNKCLPRKIKCIKNTVNINEYHEMWRITLYLCIHIICSIVYCNIVGSDELDDSQSGHSALYSFTASSLHEVKLY